MSVTAKMGSFSLLNLTCVFFLFMSLVASTPFISDHVFESPGSTARSLLQNKEGCSVNFEFLNYTVITSKCKGPRYLSSLCCPAFKQFACPYVEEINDLNTECATTMFSYINLYGKYPPGLFASQCREGKDGLDCTGYLNSTTSPDTAQNTGCIGQTFSLYLVAAASLVLLFQMF